MTDPVLTLEEVEQLASLNETMLNGLPQADAHTLINSHQVLHRRHRQLLRRVKELQEGLQLDIEMERTRE
jgi:hypothetical protein